MSLACAICPTDERHDLTTTATLLINPPSMRLRAILFSRPHEHDLSNHNREL